MRVETSVTVPKLAISDFDAQRRLVEEARLRLAELGAASEEALADEPEMVISEGDIASRWVNVTFRWERH